MRTESPDMYSSRLAKVSERAFAALIDYGAFALILYLTLIGLGISDSSGGQLAVTPIAVFFTLWIAWFPLLESWRGQTLGKKIFGLRVVQTDGGEITSIQAFKRRAADFLDFNLAATPALIIVQQTSGNQRLGDLWVSTQVLKPQPSDVKKPEGRSHA